MLALHYSYPQPRLIDPPINLIGFVFVGMGVAMNLWSAHWFRKKETTIDPHGDAAYLAQEGLYRISRNPMYLGMLVTLVGMSIYLSSVLVFLVPPLFVWIVTVRFIGREEQALLKKFGVTYVQYRARVRRWM